MPHELHASLCVVLPDGPAHSAETVAVVAGAWAEMLGKIEAHKPTSAPLTINETNRRTDPATLPRKRGRPAAGTTHAQLPVAEEV